MQRPPFHIRIANWFARSADRVGDAWHWLIGPFERLMGRLGEGVFGAFDSFAGLESAVVSVVRFVFWPLIAIGRLVASLLPESGGGAPGGRLLTKLGAATHALAERLNLDGVLLLIAKLLTPIWWPIATVLGFVNAWLATRRTREVALAAPALVLAAPFLIVAVNGAKLSRNAIAERYKIGVRDAVEAGDYRLVDLYERKLAQLDVDTSRNDYRTALVLADEGNIASAYARMKDLAPVDRPGYPSAHLWIAQKLLTGEVGANEESRIASGEETALALAERHLDHLEELEVASPGIAQLRALVYTRTDRLEKAAGVLQPYANTYLSAAAMRMRVLVMLRDLEGSRDEARRVLNLMSEQRSTESKTTGDYEAWALAAELIRDGREMEAALAAWSAAEPENERPRLLLGVHRRQEAERLLTDPTSNPARTAQTFIESAQLVDAGTWINKQTAALAGARRSSDYARKVWEALLANANTPPNLLEALGTAAASSGDIATARDTFARLIEAEVDRAISWNNYAWCLLQDPDPNPELALTAVNRALELKPADFRFRETRGQTLVALGRWEDAIADLEYALNGIPDSSEIHRSLAEAYDAVSKPQLAEIHRQQAAR